MNPILLGALLAAAGLLSIAGGVLNWDWFMNSRRAWLFVKLFGRDGARVVYVVIGTGLVVVGALAALGVLST